MSEGRSTPITQPEKQGGESPKPAQPNVPLQRPAVQSTIAVLAIACLTIILWAGRTTLWPGRQQQPLRPKVLLQIDINRADDREFALLPTVGPILAKRIVADRRQNGEFVSIQDLSRVHGIGPKKIDQIAMYCLPINRDETRVALAND